jgi:6-pyruvoyltetrahydropterin/6-carboxytetrahydropterin synthase
LHGHSYRVEVVLTADELAEPGFVTDFGDLASFGRFLAEELDHRLLNEVVPCEPTSELLAQYLAAWFVRNVEPDIPGRLVAVRVSETPSSWASFEMEEASIG